MSIVLFQIKSSGSCEVLCGDSENPWSHGVSGPFLTASVNEFIQVWALGGNATLNLTTSVGQATVGFNCSLDLPGAPHSRPPSPPSTQRQPRHRRPTENERNRQRAACHHQAARHSGASHSHSHILSAFKQFKQLFSIRKIPHTGDKASLDRCG